MVCRTLDRVAALFLISVMACAPVQQQNPVAAPAAPRITLSHGPGHGCGSEHDSLNFPNGNHINFHPYAPPYRFDHLVIHYENGDSIWGKPSYNSTDCPDSSTCQRATFILNPTWNKCVPNGHLYEVVTLDGRPVLDSSLLQVIDPQTRAIVYLTFSNGTWFAAPDLASLADQVRQAQGPSQTAPTAQGTQAAPVGHPYLQAGAQAFGAALGVTLAAALALGTAYLVARQQNLNYRASQPHPFTCTSSYVGSYWTTNCNPY
jgi:hypothetical protein